MKPQNKDTQKEAKINLQLKDSFYDKLIQSQCSEGYWNLQFDTIFDQIKSLSGLSTLNEENIALELAFVDSKSENFQRNLLTIYVLWYLQREFEDKEDEWQLIAKKATDYLKKQGYIGKLGKLFKLIEE